jgi:chaperone modulatory protein CbpM
MAKQVHEALFDSENTYSIAELSRCCRVSAETVLLLVGEGLLNPQGMSQQEWRFAGTDLIRAQCALRLQRDLGVNLAGAALALELMEERERLRRRLAAIEGLLLER